MFLTFSAGLETPGFCGSFIAQKLARMFYDLDAFIFDPDLLCFYEPLDANDGDLD